MTLSDSLAAIRKTAHAHYAGMRDVNMLVLHMSAEEAAAGEQFCKELLDAVLALPVGARFQASKWLQAKGYEKAYMAKLYAALPYLGRRLKLLDMEFRHPQLGVLPWTEVEALLETRTPRRYKDVELTDANVFIFLTRKQA